MRYRLEVGACSDDTHRLDAVIDPHGEWVRAEDYQRVAELGTAHQQRAHRLSDRLNEAEELIRHAVGTHSERCTCDFCAFLGRVWP